jgi:drug/metabolite transporter (DMT)-like permease
LLLFGGFLFLDGFTSMFQGKLYKDHVTSEYNQMLYIKLGSCTISLTTLVGSARLLPAMSFAMTHPAFAMDAMSLSAAAVCSQWFIYSQANKFGALVFAAAMNARQVVSILLSYAIYGHSIAALQVLGLVLVFAGLFYKSFGESWRRLERRRHCSRKVARRT